MTVGGQDLLTSLVWLTAFVAIAAVIVLGTVWIGRRRGSTTIALDAADTISRMWLAAIVLGLVLTVIQAFQPFVSLQGVPAVLDWPGRPDGSDPAAGTTPTLDAVTAQSVNLTASHLGAGPRWTIAIGSFLNVLLWGLPAVIVQVMTRQSLRGRSFAPRAARAFVWGAVGFLVLGTASDVVQQVGKLLVARAVLPPAHSGAALTSPDYLSLSLPLWPAAVALALAALATVFRYGTTLQAQNDALQRETEGLV